MSRNILPLYPTLFREIVHSSNCTLVDSDGNEYIDFEAGVWCANLGHSHERISQTIERQSKHSVHHGYRFWNRYADTLSEELLNITGFSNGASVFLSSGSEAVNLAIRMARTVTGRKKILQIAPTYLSAYGFGSESEGNDSLDSIPFDEVTRIKSLNFRDISSLVIETGCASMGVVRFPSCDFISELASQCEANGCIIVADEVTTGMGRTGKWFGYQHYDIKPQIVVTGKGLGNGYPISGITVDSNIREELDAKPFIYAQSHQNDPLGCAIGLEVITTLRDNHLVSRSRSIGEYFLGKLKQLGNKFPSEVKDVRGRGLMLGLEFFQHINGENINNNLFSMGFVVGCKCNTLRFMPPLTIGETQIDRLLESLNELIEGC